MGNRAVLKFKENGKFSKTGIYLHWNGGICSVRAFLKATKSLIEMGNRNPEMLSLDCQIACLVQVISNFTGSPSVGVLELENLDDSPDNGFYIIENFEIVDRSGIERKGYVYTEQEDIEKEKSIFENCISINKPFFYKIRAFFMR